MQENGQTQEFFWSIESKEAGKEGMVVKLTVNWGWLGERFLFWEKEIGWWRGKWSVNILEAKKKLAILFWSIWAKIWLVFNVYEWWNGRFFLEEIIWRELWAK
jgi:hypothetical protein